MAKYFTTRITTTLSHGAIANIVADFNVATRHSCIISYGEGHELNDGEVRVHGTKKNIELLTAKLAS